MIARPTLTEIEQAVLELSAQEFSVPLLKLSTRPVQDLGVDSIDLMEWILEIEQRFGVTLPEPGQNADEVYKEVFTREDFSLRTMAELVHLRWGSGSPERTDGDVATRPVASERGGSWVGPRSLARSSYRRGRVPHARGRCLGFRCVGTAPIPKK